MLHLFMIGNEDQPSPEDAFLFTDNFRDVIPEADIKGDAALKSLKPREFLKWAYVRVCNQTEAHNNKLYFAVSLDFEGFPKVEGIVENQVFPELMAMMKDVQNAFGLFYEGKIQRNNHALYTYAVNGASLNNAVSENIREESIKRVR